MKFSYKASVAALAAGMLLAACSKTSSSTPESVSPPPVPAPPPTAEAKPLPRVQFKDLEKFKGKPPWDLVKDELIGKEIKAIVPQSQFKCMDDIFNYMHDLEMQGDGSVQASMDGSHADQFMEAFISASPNGSVNVVLNCDPQSTPKGKYQFFTNEEAKAAPAKAVLDWMYVVGRDDDKVLKAEGRNTVEVPFEQFVQSVAPETKPANTAVATPIQTAIAPKPLPAITNLWNGWSCQTRQANGNTASDFYAFNGNGDFRGEDGGIVMTGSYDHKDDLITVKIISGRRGNTVIPSDAVIELRIKELNKEKFDFESRVVKSGTVRTSRCTVYRAPAASTPSQSNRTIRSQQGGDRVAAYANNLASQLERGSHPACGAFASNIRMLGSSGAPEHVRIRQVETMFDKVPGICLQ